MHQCPPKLVSCSVCFHFLSWISTGLKSPCFLRRSLNLSPRLILNPLSYIIMQGHAVGQYIHASLKRCKGTAIVLFVIPKSHHLCRGLGSGLLRLAVPQAPCGKEARRKHTLLTYIYILTQINVSRVSIKVTQYPYLHSILLSQITDGSTCHTWNHAKSLKLLFFGMKGNNQEGSQHVPRNPSQWALSPYPLIQIWPDPIATDFQHLHY